MNRRLATIAHPAKPFTGSARSYIVSTLAQEILDDGNPSDFPLESEYRLCERFGVSRVTIRAALGELVARGLVYRRHGKGTFAFGHSGQNHRHIGVLIRADLSNEDRHLAELIRGVQTFAHTVRAAVILISQCPNEWTAELTRMLSGVIVVSAGLTPDDLSSLSKRDVPFLIIDATGFSGPKVLVEKAPSGMLDYFGTGRRAAEALTQAYLKGEQIGDLHPSTAHAVI